jgi:hypothetical protein
MSLAIDVDKVAAVLLAGDWYEVVEASFSLDAYEFIWGEQLLHGGGRAGICSTGFSFKISGGALIAGPLDQITAVRYRA